MGGRIAARSVLWIVIICTLSAVFGAVMTVVLTRIVAAAAGARPMRCRAGSPRSSRKAPARFRGSSISSRA